MTPWQGIVGGYRRRRLTFTELMDFSGMAAGYCFAAHRPICWRCFGRASAGVVPSENLGHITLSRNEYPANGGKLKGEPIWIRPEVHNGRAESGGDLLGRR